MKISAAESLVGEHPATCAFRELVENELPCCLTELLQALEESAASCGQAEAAVTMAGELAAAIGFNGDHVSGSVLVSLPADLARRLSPVTCQPDVGLLADFTGELANQLLGRLKNRLLRFGLDVHLSTPSVMAGEQVRGLGDTRHAVIRSAVCLGQPVETAVTAQVSPSLVLVETDELPQAEGEDLFF